MILLPFSERRQELHCFAFVANEVVIDQKHLASPAQLVKELEFFHHLLRRLGPGHPAV